MFSFPPISRGELQAEMKLFTRGKLIHQLQEPRPGGAPIRESESVTDLGTPEQRPGDPQAEHCWEPRPVLPGDLLMTHRAGTGNWDLSRVESDPRGPQPGRVGAKALRKQESASEGKPPPAAVATPPWPQH